MGDLEERLLEPEKTPPKYDVDDDDEDEEVDEEAARESRRALCVSLVMLMLSIPALLVSLFVFRRPGVGQSALPRQWSPFLSPFPLTSSKRHTPQGA